MIEKTIVFCACKTGGSDDLLEQPVSRLIVQNGKLDNLLQGSRGVLRRLRNPLKSCLAETTEKAGRAPNSAFCGSRDAGQGHNRGPVSAALRK